MPVLNLPDPENWSDGRRRLAAVTLVVAAFVALGMTFGIRAVLRGDYYLTAMLFGLQVPIVLTLAAIHLVANGRTSLNARADATGATFRVDRTYSRMLLVVFASIVPLGIYYVVFTLSGDLEMFTGRGRLASVLSMATVAGFGVWGLLSAWRRGGVGYVKLTSTGIEIANIVRTKFVAWQDVVAIADSSESKKTRKAVVLMLDDGTEQVIDGADFYVPDGAGLYWMVRHYWQHPGDRLELTDGKALVRLSEGRFGIHG